MSYGPEQFTLIRIMPLLIFTFLLNKCIGLLPVVLSGSSGNFELHGANIENKNTTSQLKSEASLLLNTEN